MPESSPPDLHNPRLVAWTRLAERLNAICFGVALASLELLSEDPRTLDDLAGILDFPKSVLASHVNHLRLRKLIEPDTLGSYHLTPAGWDIFHALAPLVPKGGGR